VSDAAHTLVIDSPVGPLTLVASEAGLREVRPGGAGTTSTAATARLAPGADGLIAYGIVRFES